VKHTTPPGLSFLDGALAGEREQSLLREREAPSRRRGPGFSSNDYLALAALPAPVDEAGAGASRLVAGDRPVHAALERAAAELVGHPAALVFTSGYAANVGVLSALARPGDRIISDALNHASIIDGARLSRAEVCVVPHLDVDAVEAALRAGGGGRAFVVTESYFSMDADSPDLVGLREVCDAHGAALVVDEAHALGVLGPDGRGLCAAVGVSADVLVGTFGKAFGAGGAFVAGCPSLVAWLWNRARSFVFSTGLSPVVAAAALQGMARAREGEDRRQALESAASRLRRGLDRLGVPARGYGHIVPWVLGDAARALRVANALRARDLDVCAIRPPSVPVGTARLRLTVSSAHEAAHIDALLEGVRVALAADGR
jgi:8-amino-7-oxononanoate synthase